jgi:NADPH:quinone reductase-like Zn-dependent oxidoreductase
LLEFPVCSDALTKTTGGIVRRRYKVLIGIAGVLVVSIGTLMAVTAYDSDCPAAFTAEVSGDSMRAVVVRCYGVPQAARLERVAKPVPGDGQVLIKVRASSVNPVEWYRMSGQPLLLRVPDGIGSPKNNRVGYDLAGVIEAVGPNVTRFKVGDEIFGGAGAALAEYTLARETGAIVLKPANLSFEEAAAIPIAAVTALQGLRDNGLVKPGHKVLINGASGGVGTYAVQIAKALGAEVTGVCSTRNVELVRSLGADHVIDYTQQDFTEGSERYDVILDNIGNHSYFALEKVTQPQGRIVTVGGSKKNPWLGPISRVAWRVVVDPFVEPELPFFVANVTAPDLEWLATLARDGKLKSPIDRRYPLEQVGAALEYIGSQRARGKVVVTLN